MDRQRIKSLLTLGLIVLSCLVLYLGEEYLGKFNTRVLNLAAIFVILGASMNLVLGFTGMFSLGHAGFMCVGAYVSAILTMSPESKEMIYFMEPIISPLDKIHWPLFPAIITAGLVAALFGFLIGFPALRLRDDYLAIATLGFGEIIRIVVTNAISVTNGSLGLKNIPPIKSLWVYWGFAIATIWILKQLINSSWGYAFKAIRDNEIAAEAMGIDIFKHKLLSFTIGAFFAGLAGALMGHLITSVDPTMFRFLFTFQILLIIVLGGLGSLTGSVIAGVLVTVMMEALRFVEQPMNFFGLTIPGIPGMRMVIFSLLLLAVILFYRQGLMGTREFNWDWVLDKLGVGRRKEKGVGVDG
ncbi:branched-chain amino acid ABC transporter permease [Desulforamulus hydrothermalis]|uniref:Amino acid/amide ABC transporter membrane protein 2, HAAT family n=1 Tax=Desulforamulus hydrothermalis Lam5 = DSM 18033 TaxID=1121428 RepID=K8DYT5_9FIRM|nr:branched-chain amino acid ABC transporter permease [Desulforamulus hydrothermalis]CCO08117.1 Amino acid/amide ABC transporter membrane protein 2, HAAT family [Desulforamulus hydrothermalis Lam5 = DSM 18033]SHG81620.1 amino acid/amide ABC transporter membrane protein 2, HAAT family [Desulforamulus hydrothermalis Lam5 = DSM 18033]